MISLDVGLGDGTNYQSNIAHFSQVKKMFILIITPISALKLPFYNVMKDHVLK